MKNNHVYSVETITGDWHIGLYQNGTMLDHCSKKPLSVATASVLGKLATKRDHVKRSKDYEKRIRLEKIAELQAQIEELERGVINVSKRYR